MLDFSISDNKSDYVHYCQTAEDVPIFFECWYLDSVCAWEALVVKKGKATIGVMPYFLKRRMGMRYIIMPPFVKFLGPHLLPAYRTAKYEHLIFELLLEHLPKIDGFKQNFSPLISNWLPFYWRGFQQTTFYTYRLNNLQNLTAIFDGFNRNIKRNIKKAEAQLTVLEDLPPKLFYTINQKSFDRQNMAMPYSLAQFLKHDAALSLYQARKIFYAVDEQQQIHAVAYLIWDKQSSYYHLSGDDPKLRSSGAGILLIWKAIQYTAHQLKLNTFDFEGSMIPAVERIRIQFGATQAPYFFIWKHYSTRYQWLDTIKKWWNRHR